MVKTVNSILHSLTLSIPPPITRLLPSVLPSLPPSLPPSFHPSPHSPPSIQMRQLGTTPSGSLQKAPSISRQSARERISTGAGAAEGASGGVGPGPGTEGDNISLASNVTMGEILSAAGGLLQRWHGECWPCMCVGVHVCRPRFSLPFIAPSLSSSPPFSLSSFYLSSILPSLDSPSLLSLFSSSTP